jgi:MFS family permease
MPTSRSPVNTVTLPAKPPADTRTDARLEPETLFSRGRRGACVAAVALVSLLAFEAMAVAAAMPAIADALDGLGLYAIAFGGMLATSVLGMVLAGRSCDRHGPLHATVAGLVVFAVGLLLAGFAPGMAWLVAGRILQGLGSGMLGVALYVGMGQLVPQALHPRLFALLAAAWVLPGLLGPVLAAWLVGQLGWRSVFLVVAVAVPVAAALLLPALRRLPAPPPRTGDADGPVPKAPPAALRWAVLAMVGALLLHGAGPAQASIGAWAIPMLVLMLGLVCAGAAATRLLPHGSLVAAPGLPAVIALRGLLASAFFTAEVFVPLMLTREEGWSLTRAGLVLSVGAVLWSFGSALQARIGPARQRQLALQAGFAAVAAGVALMGLHLLTGLSVWLVVAGWAVAGLGIGLSFPMLSVLTLALSAPGEQGRNASALQLCDALCSSAALALAGALFNLAGARGPSGYAWVLALALGLALTGAWLGRRAFQPSPAETGVSMVAAVAGRSSGGQRHL